MYLQAAAAQALVLDVFVVDSLHTGFMSASCLPQEEEEAASQAIFKAGEVDVVIHGQRCKRQICPARQQSAYEIS